MATYKPDEHNRNCITVNHPDGSSITVYEHGAHLSSWRVPRPDGPKEVLYLSPTAVYKERVALRGGVPLIFPQFGNRGPLSPSHGFARIRPWKLVGVNPENGQATFSLRATTQEIMPEGMVLTDTDKNAVQLYYTIYFDKDNLKLAMKVVNTSEEATIAFNFAFHTYFRVEDINKTVINGLNLTSYVDNLKIKSPESTQLSPPQPVWKIHGEFDRIYQQQRCSIIVQEPLSAKRNVVNIGSTSLKDVVVWNPWVEKAKKLSDMPDEDYLHFLCVEHGNILKKVILPPHNSWVGEQQIHLLECTQPDSKL